jgi:hypothetical protein
MVGNIGGNESDDDDDDDEADENDEVEGSEAASAWDGSGMSSACSDSFADPSSFCSVLKCTCLPDLSELNFTLPGSTADELLELLVLSVVLLCSDDWPATGSVRRLRSRCDEDDDADDDDVVMVSSTDMSD